VTDLVATYSTTRTPGVFRGSLVDIGGRVGVVVWRCTHDHGSVQDAKACARDRQASPPAVTGEPE